MWWSRAALFLAVLALGPVGCGFQPLYARSQAGVPAEVSDALSSIRVRAIEDRRGQMLRNALVRRLTPSGEPGRASYDLTVTLTTTIEGLGQQKDDRATLGRMTVTATYVLVTAGDGDDARALTTGNARSVVSFNYLGPRYGSVAVERDAEDRALDDVADGIRRQLGVYFAKARSAQGAAAP